MSAGERTTDFQDRLVYTVERSASLELLESRLAERAVSDELMELFGALLRGPQGPDTWNELRTAVDDYIGVETPEDGLTLVDVVLFVIEPTEVRDALRAALESRPGVAQLIRRIIATHRAGIRRAFEIWNEPAHDWRSVDPHVVREYGGDGQEAAPVVRLTIEKNNGETVYLEADVDSFVALTTQLLRVLRNVPDWSRARQHRTADLVKEATWVIEDARELISELEDEAQQRAAPA